MMLKVDCGPDRIHPGAPPKGVPVRVVETREMKCVDLV